MAELNLKQIIDRLNAEFTGESRKLVFWYDDKAEFAEDMETAELTNAKIYRLRPDNQFYTKYFLERVDRTTNYLIYAPFPKPDVRENHLEDTLLYSKRFFADRASLLLLDLGIAEKYKPLIEQHIKFFANKERSQRFYDLEIENFNEENILIGLLSAVCRAHTSSFEEVLRIVLTEKGNFPKGKERLSRAVEVWRITSSFGSLKNTSCCPHSGGSVSSILAIPMGNRVWNGFWQRCLSLIPGAICRQSFRRHGGALSPISPVISSPFSTA